MREHPILFNGPMIRALLDGTKTQTRRVVKNLALIQDVDDGIPMLQDGYGDWVETAMACPYGQPGDRLWARETFTRHEDESGFGAGKTLYRADMDNCDIPWTWTPSIHMPRWASRITLEITSVRVERLHDISEADAKAEGVTDIRCAYCGYPVPCGPCQNPSPDPRSAYLRLWESINGPGSWESNPWVWVVEFKRVQP